jgi:hypothetical protein
MVYRIFRALNSTLLHLVVLLPSLQTHPCNENRVFPLKKAYTGKTLFSLQGWVCSAVCTLVSEMETCRKVGHDIIRVEIGSHNLHKMVPLYDP